MGLARIEKLPDDQAIALPGEVQRAHEARAVCPGTACLVLVQMPVIYAGRE